MNPLHPDLRRAYDPDRFARIAHEVVDDLADFLRRAQQRSAPRSMPWAPPEEERAHWENRAPGQDLPALLREVVARSNSLQDPRYIGHQVAAPFPDVAIVGLVTDLLNNGGAIYEMGPTNVAMEEILMARIGRMLGYPDDCGGVLCHGGTMANLVALLAARRHAGLAHDTDTWSAGDDGTGAVLVSEQAHYCIDRAARILGWGGAGVGLVAADRETGMRRESLEAGAVRLKAAGRRLVAVVGSACTTSTGTFDDLHMLADFAAREGVWFHVDGAHGSPAAFSPRYRDRVAGIERADSVTMDFHKIMGVSALCTGLFYRRHADSYLPFTQTADYLWNDAEDPEWWNFGKRTFECTKRMLSTRLAAVVEEFGTGIWSHLVERLFDLAGELAQQIGARADWELAMTPQANIVCFRYRPPSLADAPVDVRNAHTAALRQRMLEEGPFYIVQTRLDGELWLRCTVMNPLTEPEDFTELLDRLEELARPAPTP